MIYPLFGSEQHINKVFSAAKQVFCKCSFLEIYNENITDLLGPTEAHLQIREDAARGVYVENLHEEEVSSGTNITSPWCHVLAPNSLASTKLT